MPTEYLSPAGDNANASTWGDGYGTHIARSKALYTGTPIYSSLNDPIGSMDPTTFGWARSRITGSPANPFHWDFTFGAPPAAVVINSVKLYGYCRTSQAGANQFNAQPDVFGYILPSGCTHTAGAGTQHNGSTHTINPNTNTNTNDPSASQYTLYEFGSWTTNPHTAAAWTVADLASGGLKAGLKATSPNIPYSTGGSNNSFECAQLYLELDVTPAESYYGPAKLIAAAKLRLYRRPLRIYEAELATPVGDAEPGQTIWVVDRTYPTEDGEGAGIENWARRPIRVLEATDNVEPPTTTVRGLDMPYVSFWAPFRTDLGVTSINTGIGIYDRGGGISFARKDSGGTDQAEWLHRGQDLLFAQAAAGNPGYSPWGLVVCGGEYFGSGAASGELTWGPTYNTFSGGSGTTFTGWTQASAGAGGTMAEDTSTYLFDLDGYRRGPKFTRGATISDFDYLYQTWNTFTTNHRVRYFCKFSVHDSTDPETVYMILRRSSDSYDWVPGTGWSSGGSWHDVTSVGDGTYGYGSLCKVGNHYEYWSDEVSVGASANLTLYAGRVGDTNGSITLHAAGIAHNNANTTTSARKALRRDMVVTTAAATDQAGDRYALINHTDYKFLDEDVGFVSLVFVPFWAHTDLDTGSEKHLFTIVHDVTNDDYHRVYYYVNNSTTGTIRFQRVRGGASVGIAEYSLSGSSLAAYMTAMKVGIRWVGTDAEHGIANRTLSVFVGGVKGTDAVASNDCRYDGTDSVAWIGLGSSLTIHHFGEGMFSDVQTWKGRCPSDIGVARIHAESGRNLDLPTVLYP